MTTTDVAEHTPLIHLPKGWAWVPLTDIASLNPPLDSKPTNDDQEVYFVPMATVEEDFLGIQHPELRTYGQVKKGYTPFQSGDVIMAKITPCMENGKGGIVHGGPGGIFFGSTEFHVFRPNLGVEAKWVGAFLAQKCVRRAARLKMKGSAGQLRVPASFFEHLYIPLPPTNEQIRIIDRLDELFSDLSAGMVALERVKRKLARYRAAVLHAAVTGRLTESWRKKHGPVEEPGSKLLERILAERRRQWEQRTMQHYEQKGKVPPKNWRSRYLEPKAPKLGNDDATREGLSNGWCCARVEQLTHIIQYGTSAKTNNDASGIPVLRMGNINTIGAIDFTDMKYLPKDHDEFPELFLVPGDVLFNRTNSAELVGKTAVFAPSDKRTMSFASYLIRVRTIQGCSPWWLTWCIISPLGHQWLRRVLNHTAGQANVNGTKLGDYIIPLPPVDEQNAIIDIVNEKLSQIDALEFEVTANLSRASRLRQSILKLAFEGKLVSQDIDDESASILLESIKNITPRVTPRRSRMPNKKNQERSMLHE